MATDRELLKAAQIGHVASSTVSNAQEAILASHRRTYGAVRTSAATNATENAAATVFFYVARKSKMRGLYVVPSANVTAHASNFVTFIAKKNDGAGGAFSNVAVQNTNTTANSGTGNLTSYSAHSITLSTASDAHVLAAGSLVSVEWNYAASGTAIPASSWHLDVEEV